MTVSFPKTNQTAKHIQIEKLIIANLNRIPA